jgi:transposase
MSNYPFIDSMFGPFKNKVLSILEDSDPVLKSRKLSHVMCLECILKILKKGLVWRDIGIDGIHYTTFYKRFAKWAKLNVFKSIWHCLIDLYVSKKLKVSKTWFKVLFIDSTMVKNINGRDCIGRNHYDRNRFATKVSMICDDNKVPLASTFYPANKHDATTITDTLDALVKNIMPDKRCIHNLVADKGYIISSSKRVDIESNYNTKLITPKRKNQKIQTTYDAKKLLKNRICIEHLFRTLDFYKRIKNREEHNIQHYECMNFLAMSIITISKM